MKKVYLHSLGCDKNTVDGEYLLGDLVENGFEITKDPNQADLIIVNTCCFIEEAKVESINAIFDLINYIDYDKSPKFVVSGCLVERYKDELIEEIPEVDLFAHFKETDKILALFDQEKEVEGKRFLENNAYGYLKISEGCNRNCTYCAIPNIKGRHKSRAIEDILKEAKTLEENGTKELILIAQDLTQYGSDTDTDFASLLKEISENTSFEWIRLLYLYPEGINEELIKVIKESENIIPYFDIPIQHTNNRILKLMGRKISKKEIYNKIQLIRDNLPDSVIRSTVIVGFPSETEEEFNQLISDLKALKFDRLGAFKYSREEGTPAYLFEDQIDDKVKDKRLLEVNRVQNEIMKNSNKRFVDRILPAIIEEEIDSNTYSGRIYADSPDIDNIIYINSPKKLQIGELEFVKILSSLDYEFIGDLYEPTK